MATPQTSRRDMLGLLAGLPFLAAAMPTAAGTVARFSEALAHKPELLGFATVRSEHMAAGLATVAGRLPTDLVGVLWRNGPAEHERFGHRYRHWFDGDGMVQAFTFTGAGVEHRARVLDTPKRRRETAAGRRSLPAFATIPEDPAPVRGPDDMNAANTAMLVHAGHLMALWEGGSALHVDPETLAAGEFRVWRPDLAGLPFSAHPKVERDGTLWNIGVTVGRTPVLLVYHVDRYGDLVRAGAIRVDDPGMVHDFIVTSRSIVVLLSPFVLDFDSVRSGRVSHLDAHLWRPELGTRVLVIDKNTLSVSRRYQLPAGFHFHHGNGWEEADGTIRLDVCQAPDPGFVTRDLRQIMDGTVDVLSNHPSYRCVVLPPGGSAEATAAVDGIAEFPRIDPRHTGSRHDRVFVLRGADSHRGWPFDRIACLNSDGGEVGGWTYPEHHIPEEHVFVPTGSAEGAGWLLGPFLDTRQGVAGLNILAADRLNDGPVWQGQLPYPLPLGLHGTFDPA